MNKKGAELLEEPEGEKPLKIGNADLVFRIVFRNRFNIRLWDIFMVLKISEQRKSQLFTHLHLYAIAFSEAGQTKYVSIINAEPGKQITYEKVTLKNGKPLVRKTFQNVESAIEWLNENQNCLVELTLESETF
jgi:exonuclease SbcD